MLYALVSLQVSVLVMCHTRELAFQISKEYERFSKYMSSVKTAVFFGGMQIQKDEQVLKSNCPHVVVGTPGRILALIKNKSLILKHVKHFILDECDKMLEQLGMSAAESIVGISLLSSLRFIYLSGAQCPVCGPHLACNKSLYGQESDRLRARH